MILFSQKDWSCFSVSLKAVACCANQGNLETNVETHLCPVSLLLPWRAPHKDNEQIWPVCLASELCTHCHQDLDCVAVIRRDHGHNFCFRDIFLCWREYLSTDKFSQNKDILNSIIKVLSPRRLCPTFQDTDQYLSSSKSMASLEFKALREKPDPENQVLLVKTLFSPTGVFWPNQKWNQNEVLSDGYLRINLTLLVCSIPQPCLILNPCLEKLTLVQKEFWFLIFLTNTQFFVFRLHHVSLRSSCSSLNIAFWKIFILTCFPVWSLVSSFT